MNTAQERSNTTGPAACKTVKWIRSDDAVGCDMEGEMVLLHVVSGTYFGLNAIGAEIWNQLAEPKSLAVISTHLLERYSVSPERCIAEVKDLLVELNGQGLVRSVEDETPA